jgi:DNA-directed RNA polymerase III subunit RPC8
LSTAIAKEVSEFVHSDPAEMTWIWHLEDVDDLFFDAGDTVNFRVESEQWNDQAPTSPKVRKQGEPEPDPATEYKVPYSIEVWL